MGRPSRNSSVRWQGFRFEDDAARCCPCLTVEVLQLDAPVTCDRGAASRTWHGCALCTVASQYIYDRNMKSVPIWSCEVRLGLCFGEVWSLDGGVTTQQRRHGRTPTGTLTRRCREEHNQKGFRSLSRPERKGNIRNRKPAGLFGCRGVLRSALCPVFVCGGFTVSVRAFTCNAGTVPLE